MDSLGRMFNAAMAIGLWVLAFLAGIGSVGTDLYWPGWIIVATICLVGGCIVFSRQCVGK